MPALGHGMQTGPSRRMLGLGKQRTLRLWYALPPNPDSLHCLDPGVTGHNSDTKLTPTQTVARALREHCNIPFESFFLATHLGHGNFAYFSGPSPIAEENIRKMFMRDKYLKFQERASLSKFKECHIPS